MEVVMDAIGWLSKVSKRGTVYSYFRGTGYLKAPRHDVSFLSIPITADMRYTETRHDSEVAVWLMTLQDLTKNATLHPEVQWCLAHSKLDELQILLLLEHIAKYGVVNIADVLSKMPQFMVDAFQHRKSRSCPALIVQAYLYLSLRGYCELTRDWDLVTLLQLEASIPSLTSCVSCNLISNQLQGIVDINSASEIEALQLTLKKGRMSVTEYCDLANVITKVYASGV